jgi:hypothetical protein
MIKRNLFARLMNSASDSGSDTGGGDSNEEAQGSGNDARVAMLNRINDMNDGHRADEMADVNDDGTTATFVSATLPVTDAEDADMVQAELDRLQAEANSSTTDDTDAPLIEEMFNIRVNGKDKTLTRTQMIAHAQKIEAADSYLAEASRIKRDAEIKAVQPVPSPNREVEQAAALEDRRALVRAIQMGSEDEAMAALDKLQRPMSPSLTQDDLARTVDERLTFKSAIAKFETEYDDVLSDPVLKQLALQRDNDALVRGDSRDYWTRYQSIGDELRAWKNGIAAQPSAKPAPTALETKQIRKAAVNPAPSAASVKTSAAVQDDDREESVAEVISAIAKARGGPQWSRA